MTGEMHESEVTAENFPVHFAAAKEFDGDVHPFDQYQGPYITIPAKYNTASNRRFFLSTDDGVFACWWDESNQKFSPAFTATDDPQDLVFAVAAFRQLIEEGGTDEPEYRTSLIIDADGTLTLLHSLSSYISGDDVDLPREEFLRMVADRITEDLEVAGGYVTREAPAKPAPVTELPPAASLALLALAKRLESPHADMVFVGRDFTKRDVIAELTRIAGSPT